MYLSVCDSQLKHDVPNMPTTPDETETETETFKIVSGQSMGVTLKRTGLSVKIPSPQISEMRAGSVLDTFISMLNKHDSDLFQ